MTDPILPRRIDRLSAIADAFDLFLVDVWGTIYDGQAAFAGVADRMVELRRLGKRIVLLSNSPQVPATVAGRMQRIGIDRSCFDAIVTSGGETRAALSNPDRPDMARFSGRVLQFGPGRFPDTLPPNRFEQTTDIGDADWILNAGPDQALETVADYEPILHAGVRRRLPMMCANPDRIVHHGAETHVCAGALADRYAELGGYVHAIGKPHGAVFARCLALFPEIAADRVIMVGDNLETDIMGANRAGIASLLIAAGVHALIGEQGKLDCDRLQALQRHHGVQPDYVIERIA